MSIHNFITNMARADWNQPDPGTGNALPRSKSGIINIVTGATAETNTLADPAKEGLFLCLNMFTDGGGDRTITVASAYDQVGSTVMTLQAVGETFWLRSIKFSTGYRWKLVHKNIIMSEIITTTRTVRAEESGKTFYIDLAAGFVTTLPAVALGLNYKFIVKTALTGSATIVCPAAAALFKGHVLTNDVNSGTDSDFGTSGEATITFVLNKSVAGDRCEVNCDGTIWHVSAACSVFDAITIS